MAVDRELLEKIELFHNFSKRQLQKVASLCEQVDFNENERLFTEGDPATHLWLVAKGGVDLRFEMPDQRVTTTEQTVSSVKVAPRKSVARTLGWSCFVPPYKMRLSAYCVTSGCRMIRIPKQKLLKLFEDDPLLGYRFMSYLITVVGYRFHQFQDVVAKSMGDTMMSGW